MYQTPQPVDQNFQRYSFAEYLAKPHQMSVLAQIEKPDGTLLAYNIGVLGGEVTVDRTAAIRRQLKLTLQPFSSTIAIPGGGAALSADQAAVMAASLIPSQPSDLTAPYGNQVRLWYGLDVPGYVNPTTGLTTFLSPLGNFRIADAAIDDSGVPAISITGYDRSRTISRNKLTQPWLVAAGTNFGDAIIALVQDRDKTAPVRGHLVTATTPAIVVDPEQDPWQVVTDWATSIGYEVYFDAEGYLTITPEPDPSVSPVSWVYAGGAIDANAVILSVSRSMNDEPGYNGVVMTAESTTLPAPLRSEVWDLNPSSPTYSLGAYGKVPKFVSNPYIATQLQCDAAASAELLRSIGGTERVSLACVPNPCHEAGDVIRVQRPLTRIDSVGIIESFSLPLDPGSPMQITCKERRSIS